MEVTYIVDDKLGGVSSLCFNLVKNAPLSGYEQIVIHTDLAESDMTRANLIYPGAKNIRFGYTGKESQYQCIRSLFNCLTTKPGALIVNYQFEMEMLDHYAVPQTVYQLVHDDYNFGLAKAFSHVVDVFIAHNKHLHEQLKVALPSREQDIFYRPHGVSVPSFFRKPVSDSSKPLKLLFLGRMNRRKGIFDLPVIDRLLAEKQIPVEWTCIGNGPEKQELLDHWNNKTVQFASPATNEEVLSIAAQHDIFVLPTKFEGSPVSLLETMSVGLVPVITDLEGGIREIVQPPIGYRIAMDQNEKFADAIAVLHHDREKINSMSAAARAKIELEFSVQQTAKGYHQLFQEYGQRFRTKTLKRKKIGARLDQPWLPYSLTRLLRSLLSK